MTVAFDLLAAGNLFGSFLEAYNYAGVSAAYLYMMLVGLAAILLYIKSRDLTMVGLLFVISGGILIPLLDQTLSKYFFGIVIVGLGLGIYALLFDR